MEAGHYGGCGITDRTQKRASRWSAMNWIETLRFFFS